MDSFAPSRVVNKEEAEPRVREQFSVANRETQTIGPPSLLNASERPWLLVEEGFTLAREHEVESLFAIGNGYVGNRGSLAEGSPLSAPATFLAGVFEHSDKPGAIPQLMTLPDWTCVRVWIDDQPLNMQEGEVLEHRRILDMRRGILWREWRHRSPDGRITRILAYRLASLADRHLLLQSVILTSENYTAALRFESSIEIPPNATAASSPKWKTRRSAERTNVLPLALKCPGRDIEVAFGAASQMLGSTSSRGERQVEIDDRRILERFHIVAGLGSECQLHREISIYTSRDVEEPLEAAVAHVNRVLPSNLSAAIEAHQAEWGKRWARADIRLEGDDSLQRALRFAEYHLISAANPEDTRVSIGARALSGEAYKGHVFWDTEIYMVPFYVFTHPPSARALLAYRYHALAAAREKAKLAGFRGAMYPWESADTGEETTPKAVIAPNGEVIPVRNGELEIHITADVAFAIWQYWTATGDDDFFLSMGAEILLETARFWASRGELDKDGTCHIRKVIGPDEYHENVDDNAYTNLMARWNLLRGYETAECLQRRWPDRWRDLQSRCKFTEQEISAWPKLANCMYTGFDPKTLLFEQFRGYYDKEPVDLKRYEPRSAAMDVILGHKRINATNVVKQADVVMGLYLLWDDFPADVRKANFDYYEPRTGHGSSLSPAMHALVAARLGDGERSRQYLKQAAEIDLGNNMGNAAGGVHAAAIGGLWQAMVFGFAGLQVMPDGLSFTPHMLRHWESLSFPLEWQRRKLQMTIEKERVRVTVRGSEPLKVHLTGSGETLALPDREYAAERRDGKWSGWSAVA